MPTYVYRCTNCEHEFEIRQRMTDDPLTECPECGGKIRRVVNSVGVVFKGQGFYVTDNRGKKAQPPSSISSKKEEGGGENSSTSSDSNNGGKSKSSESSESKPSKSEKSSTSA
jgi:putative FmdB family regulatory protein